MKKLSFALALMGATLALAGAANANLSVGVNDDASKDAGVSSWFYSTMQSVGLKINTLTVLWDEGAPTDIAGAAAIDQAITKAKASGVTIELDLYPMHSTAFTGGSKCAPRRVIRRRAATRARSSSSHPGPHPSRSDSRA